MKVGAGAPVDPTRRDRIRGDARHTRNGRVKPPLVLDTHAWLWWLFGQPDLAAKEREAQMLFDKGRLELDSPLTHWLPTAVAAESVSLLPMDVGVILALDDLPKGFHGDPADRIIVSTARAYGLPLATRDGNIRRSRSVKLWKA